MLLNTPSLYTFPPSAPRALGDVPSVFFSRRFLPLFLCQLLGGINDNLLKNSLFIIITYLTLTPEPVNDLLVSCAAGLFILPFFLFSAAAGHLADAYDKALLIRWIKGIEVALAILVMIGFMLPSIGVLMFCLFLVGVHYTFFLPLKYAILPQHFHRNDLPLINACFGSSTFFGILLGTLASGVLIPLEHGPAYVGGIFLLLATLGFATSCGVPPALPLSLIKSPPPPRLIKWRFWGDIWSLLVFSYQSPRLFLCLLGISWFWLIGAAFLTLCGPFCRDILLADTAVMTFFLMLFSLGIALGSFLSIMGPKGKKKHILIPLSMAAFSLMIADLCWALQSWVAPTDHLMGLSEFLHHIGHWRISVDFFLMAVCGGVYSVPLYVNLQQLSSPPYRARIQAANNVMNALFMVTIIVMIMGMFALGLTEIHIFMMLGITNFGVALYTYYILPPKGLIRSKGIIFYKRAA